MTTKLGYSPTPTYLPHFHTHHTRTHRHSHAHTHIGCLSSLITLIPKHPSHSHTHPPSTRHKHTPAHTHTHVSSLTSTHPYLRIQLTPYPRSPPTLSPIFFLHTHKLRIPLFLQSLQERTNIHTYADTHPRSPTYTGILAKTSTHNTSSNYHHCLKFCEIFFFFFTDVTENLIWFYGGIYPFFI